VVKVKKHPTFFLRERSRFVRKRKGFKVFTLSPTRTVLETAQGGRLEFGGIMTGNAVL